MISRGSHEPPFLPTERPECFAFIDYDNMTIGLRQTLERLHVPEDRRSIFDLKKLFEIFRSDRYYFYSAVPESGEIDDQVPRIRRASGFIFRSGVLTKNSGRSKQQGVDVLMATDALQHAYRRTMRHCYIISGDGDFLPLIDALVDSGIYTYVVSFGNPEMSSVAANLQDASDQYFHVGAFLLSKCFSDEHQITQAGNMNLFGSMDFELREHSFLGQVHVIFDHPHAGVALVRDEAHIEELRRTATVSHIAFRTIEGCEEWIRLNPDYHVRS